MRKLLVIGSLALGLLGGPHLSRADALPRGCASATSDASIDADAFRRRVGMRLYRDEPCTFVFEAGDTYTGSGRFSVACASGGYLLHPDHEDDTPAHDDQLVPIPQPCKPGDLVTIDGFHPFTGGSVIAGGLGTIPRGLVSTRRETDAIHRASRVPSPNADFASLCDAGTAPVANVSLTAPVARSGRLTFGGSVDCRGAAVTIKTVRISSVGGFPGPAYAPSTSCRACNEPVSTSNWVRPTVAEFDVEMSFDVTRRGKPTVHAYRLGRYFVSWGGHVTTLYPTPADDASLIF